MQLKSFKSLKGQFFMLRDWVWSFVRTCYVFLIVRSVVLLFVDFVCILATPNPMRECPRTRRFRANLLLRTTCMLGGVSGVVA